MFCQLHDTSMYISIAALTSVVNVRIIVRDVNDNPPRFGQDIYTTSVPEFLAQGGTAFQVIYSATLFIS